MTENGHSVWSSCLRFADQIRSFNIVVNIGHGGEAAREYSSDSEMPDPHEEEIQGYPIAKGIAQGA